MTNHFCTISTKSHLGKTYALCHSIIEINNLSKINVLITDEKKVNVSVPDNLVSFINLFDADDLENDDWYKKTFRIYSSHPDKMRWTLKPVFLRWLLKQQSSVSKIIYTDNDIYFIDNYNFLFEMLEENNILLTPHWRADNPFKHPWWFETNFRDGIFNAGFVGVNKNSIAALEWWATVCLYKCKKSYIQGLFDDQKYLDLMPVIEPKTAIVQHRGCNVAGWNIIKLKRNIAGDKIIIDNTFPLIFVHFADCTIAAIHSGNDNILENLFLKYDVVLKQYGFELNLNAIAKKEKFWGHYRHIKWLLTGGLFVLLSSRYRETKFYVEQHNN
jgi:hypothetical protein